MRNWITPLALCAGMLGIAFAQEAAAPAGAKTAYINVKQALQDYKLTGSENSRLRAERAKLQATVDEMAGQLADAKNKLELIVPSHPQYVQQKHRIAQLEAGLKAEREWSNYRIGVLYASATTRVYADLLAMAKTIATERGLHTIEKVETGLPSADSMVEVNIRINGRAILYHDPALDITDEVVRRLNAK